MSATLFIIEAPGKVKLLHALLRQAGESNCRVIATKGHIGKNPDTLNPPHIDENYKETAYRLDPAKENLAKEISEASSRAKKIYLAMDDDHEGDVIARDVVRFCISDEDRPKALRVRLRALSQSELGQSLQQAEPFNETQASPGDARRILDRLIGGMSDDNVAVGRVQGTLLLLLAKQQPVFGVMTYSMAAKDGGAPWLAKKPIFSSSEQPEGVIIDHTASVGVSHNSYMSAQPMNYNEILLSASLALDQPITAISNSLQSLYETGRMSYPRSKDRAISPESFARIQTIASINGCGFTETGFSHVRIVAAYGHEAPNPVGIDVPVNRDMQKMITLEEKVLVHITRNLIDCGIPCRYEEPRHEDITGLHPEVSNLRWYRVVPSGQVLWERPAEVAGIKKWTAEQSVSHFCNHHHLGRPSTIVSHINKFLDRGLIDEEMNLNNKGKEWSNHIDGLFHSQNISKAIEAYLESHSHDPSEMVAELLGTCGLEKIKTTISQQQVTINEEYEI